jgi:hypothetical protein
VSTTHEHDNQGQKLRHSHPGGDRPHGYFEHPEDGQMGARGEAVPAVEAGEPVWQVTRAMVGEIAGRELTEAEFAAVAKGIEFSSAGDCVREAVAQVCGLPDEEDFEDPEDADFDVEEYDERRRREDGEDE